MDRQAILKSAVERWGADAQVRQLGEEMTELTIAINKLRRMPAELHGTAEHFELEDNVREKLADVQIMLDQMKLLFGECAQHEAEKLERLRGRLQGCEEKGAHNEQD